MIGGVLLTGGASRRFGSDKARLELDGVTLAERAAATLTAVCEPCVEVGDGASGLPSIREVPPGSGPLAALVAGGRFLEFESGHRGDVVALAVDMPRVTADLLRLLASAPDGEAVVPEWRGRLQPLCARWSRAALERADDLVQSGASSMRSLLDQVGFRRLAEVDWREVADADAFADVDTPEDLAALRSLP